MPILDNPRHERFCQLVFEGRSQTEAYQIATGCAYESANSNAYLLMGNDGIKERITELQKAVIKKRVLTRERSLEVLHDIVETPAGAVGIDSPICQGVKYGPEGQILEVKMPAKLDALTLNAKLQGWLEPRSEGHGLMININLLGADLPMKQVVDIESQEG